jgi:hypothetical protein
VVLEEGRGKLFTARSQRVRPHRDDKILTSWNGLMISALARAAQVLQSPGIGRSDIPVSIPTTYGQAGRIVPSGAPTTDYLTAAQRVACYLLAHHHRDGRLYRTRAVPAVLDDYACLATGLLDLYETDFDLQWLRAAVELTDQMLDLFWDTKEGGFFQTDGRDSSVIVRVKEDYDGAEPSGNSMATLLLLRLARFTDSDRYRQSAEKTLALFGEHLHRAPYAVPQMLCALDFVLGKPREIIIAGKSDAADTRSMLSAVYQRYLPNKILVLADAGSAQVLKFPGAYKSMEGKATAYVCVNYACQLPTTDLAQFEKSLVSETSPG